MSAMARMNGQHCWKNSAETAATLEQHPAIIDGQAETAMRVRKDVMVICHGGPIHHQQIQGYVLKHLR